MDSRFATSLFDLVWVVGTVWASIWSASFTSSNVIVLICRYEFFPKTGGGLMVEISQTMQAFTEDDRHKITDTH